jgi:hypothetical protein
MKSGKVLEAIILAILLFIPVSLFAEVFAQSDAGTQAESAAGYRTSYQVASADVASPLTVQVENHVYSPGDDVKVMGLVWLELIERIDAIDIVKVEAKDGQGNVIARENTTVGNDGSYAATFALLDGASTGTYTIQARIEVEADALGLVNAITSAALQSSIEFAVAEPVEHNITTENQEFVVSIASNSGISEVQLNREDKKLSFFAEGNTGTTGMTEIKIPKSLLSGDMTVLIDQNIAAEDDVLLKSDTGAETTLEINYKHSIHRVEVAGTNVVPEFPLAILIMAAAIGTIAVASTVLRLRGSKGAISAPVN